MWLASLSDLRDKLLISLSLSYTSVTHIYIIDQSDGTLSVRVGAYSTIMEALSTLTLVFLISFVNGQLITNETAAQEWLAQYNQMAEGAYFDQMSARWNYNTNLTDHNSRLSVSAVLFILESLKN